MKERPIQVGFAGMQYLELFPQLAEQRIEFRESFLHGGVVDPEAGVHRGLKKLLEQNPILKTAELHERDGDALDVASFQLKTGLCPGMAQLDEALLQSRFMPAGLHLCRKEAVGDIK